MINFSELYGNEHIKKILNGSGSFSSFIIEGAVGSGRHTLANLIARSRLCTSDNPPCGKCNACKKLAAGMHVDLLSVDCGVNIKDFRESLQDVEIYPADGEHKVYIFENTEELNELKQNTLLKILEEPPLFVTFILIADTADRFLQTIRSRCAVLSLKPLPSDVLEKALDEKIKNADKELLHRSLMLSGGYIGQALDLYKKKGDGLFERCEKFAEAFVKKDWMETLSLFSFSVKDERQKFTDYILALEKYIRRCFDYSVTSVSDNLSPSEKALVLLGQEKLSLLCKAISLTAENVSSSINVNLGLWSCYTVLECKKIR